MIIIAWLVFSGLLWPLAERRGRDGYIWCFIALALSPMLATIVLFVLQDLSEVQRAEKAANERLIEKQIVSHEQFADQISKSKALFDRKIITSEEHQKRIAEMALDIVAFGIKGTDTDFLTALAGLVESGVVSMAELSTIKAALEKHGKNFSGDTAA